MHYFKQTLLLLLLNLFSVMMQHFVEAIAFTVRAFVIFTHLQTF